MSDEEDDYLSDKLLASLEAPKPSATQSYAERRRVAQRESERKRIEGRIKSRREMEEEARREGLSRSLFEREMEKSKDDPAGGNTGGSKAMSMMLKMGFKPGEALGKKEEPPTEESTEKEASAEPEPKEKKSGHLTEPLPLAVWAGRKGLGLGKRAMSPPLGGSSKATKVSAEEDAAEKSRNEGYRTRARGEYEERRDEGRLRAVLRTCATLDDANGIQFNVLQLNPSDPSTIPPALYELLTKAEDELAPKSGFRVPVGESDFDEGVGPGSDRAIAARLKEQMKADSLQPLKGAVEEDNLAMRDVVRADDISKKDVEDQLDYDDATVEAAKEYLQKNVQERLGEVLQYLRIKYFYCFWCGTNYNDAADLESNCPGLEEDDH